MIYRSTGLTLVWILWFEDCLESAFNDLPSLTCCAIERNSRQAISHLMSNVACKLIINRQNLLWFYFILQCNMELNSTQLCIVIDPCNTCSHLPTLDLKCCTLLYVFLQACNLRSSKETIKCVESEMSESHAVTRAWQLTLWWHTLGWAGGVGNCSSNTPSLSAHHW